MHKYFLVYWPEEQSVSAVTNEAISWPSACEFEVGAECEVTVRRQTYRGKIAARGDFLCIHVLCFTKVLPILS